jgi:hypothetical protein
MGLFLPRIPSRRRGEGESAHPAIPLLHSRFFAGAIQLSVSGKYFEKERKCSSSSTSRSGTKQMCARAAILMPACCWVRLQAVRRGEDRRRELEDGYREDDEGGD